MNESTGPQTDRMPVTLITGFLGAGKSTLINRFISSLPDRRFAIVVNEFGEVPLESRLIEAQKGDIIEFPNGCLCCVARNDLIRAVKQLARRENGFDHLIVEASGLSDPVPVARSFLTDSDNYAVHGVVCLVDAGNYHTSHHVFPVAETQVRFADFVLVTKWHDHSAAELQELEQELLRVNEGVPIRMLDSETPVELYLDDPQHRESVHAAMTSSHHVSAHTIIPHCTLTTDRPIDPQRFRDFIECLPDGVFRGKGVVSFSGRDGKRYKAILQIVGARRHLDAVRWKRTDIRRTDLLFIGEGLDPEALTRQFNERCLRES